MSWLLTCIGCGAKKDKEVDGFKTLDFQHSFLKHVPPDVFLSERTLEELHLDSNQLADLPAQLFHCHGVRVLTLSDNDLRAIPPAVTALAALHTLDISKNEIKDIPDNIKDCKQLTIVDASINPLCRLPEGFTQLISLRELFLNDTFLEYLPANFGRLTGLEVLELRENQLNTLPRSMSRLTALKRLDLGQNEFSELPEVVGSLPSLTDLWFDNNRVKAVRPFIGNLKNLIFIDGTKNRIDEVCAEIEHCTMLADLYLSSNDLKSFPESLGRCTKLQNLHVDDNCLTHLPDSLGKLVALEELRASTNDLETLPSSVGFLRSLHTLHLDDNLISSLPPELGSCCNLTVLTVAANQLTQLPPELGNLTKLLVLNVCENLIAYLPISFSKLKLQSLWLSENQAKPIVQLQSVTDAVSGQKVLTCFMLPQVPASERPAPVTKEEPFPGARWDEEHRVRSHITFDLNGQVDQPGRLTRAPTPYPKELRALAKHARNLQSVQKGGQELHAHRQRGRLHHRQKDTARNSEPAEVKQVGFTSADAESQSLQCIGDSPCIKIATTTTSLSMRTNQDSSASHVSKSAENNHWASQVQRDYDTQADPEEKEELLSSQTIPSEAESPASPEKEPLLTCGTVCVSQEQEAVSKAEVVPSLPLLTSHAETVPPLPPTSPPPLEDSASNSSSSTDSGYVNGNSSCSPGAGPEDAKTGVSVAKSSAVSPVSSSYVNRPNSVALEASFHNGYLAPGDPSKVTRPGSLALGDTSVSWHAGRPGSVAASINTVGIPPAPQPARAASHASLYQGCSSHVGFRPGNMRLTSASSHMGIPLVAGGAYWRTQPLSPLSKVSELPGVSSPGPLLEQLSSPAKYSSSVAQDKPLGEAEKSKFICEGGINKAFADGNRSREISTVSGARDSAVSTSLKGNSRIPSVTSWAPSSSTFSSKGLHTYNSMYKDDALQPNNLSKSDFHSVILTEAATCVPKEKENNYVNEDLSTKDMKLTSRIPSTKSSHIPMVNKQSSNLSVKSPDRIPVSPTSKIPTFSVSLTSPSSLTSENNNMSSHATLSRNNSLTQSSLPPVPSPPSASISPKSGLEAKETRIPTLSSMGRSSSNLSSYSITSTSSLPVNDADISQRAFVGRTYSSPSSDQPDGGGMMPRGKGIRSPDSSSRIPTLGSGLKLRGDEGLRSPMEMSPALKAINTPGIPILPQEPVNRTSRIPAPSVKSPVSGTPPTRTGILPPGSMSGLAGRQRIGISNTDCNNPVQNLAWSDIRSGTKDGLYEKFPVVIEKNPHIGITFESCSDGQGVMVTSVEKGGPASSALEVGDKIHQINGQLVRDAASALSAFSDSSTIVNLMVSRTS